LDVHDPALPPPDAELIRNFRRNLARDQFEECSRCQRKWFYLRLVEGVAQTVQRVDRKRESNELYLFIADNLTDPGHFPQPTEGLLPELTQFEEMLIARVHTYMEIRQHRGQQYKDSGHLCSFLCNTGRIYDELLLLPRELNVLVLRPARSKTTLAYSVSSARITPSGDGLCRGGCFTCEITIQAIEISASEMKLWRRYQMDRMGHVLWTT